MAYNGARARERRIEMGLSQYELALRISAVSRALGGEVWVRPEYISKYERGVSQPGRKAFVLLTQTLGLANHELETGV